MDQSIEVKDADGYLGPLPSHGLLAGIEGEILPMLDDAAGMPLLLVRLAGELAGLLNTLATLGDSTADLLQKLKLVPRIREIVQELGGQGQSSASSSDGDVGKSDVLEEVPVPPPTALFEFNPNIKASQRRRANSAAMALLEKINDGDVDASSLTEEQQRTLAAYSGNGGGLVGADGKAGSQYEYYTPKPLAQGVWGLLSELGFAGGKVLDPSAGTGIFGATAPDSVILDAVELDQTSGRINQLVNRQNNVTISAFEAVAAGTPDEIYDAVITNVPFGDAGARGKERFKDDRYQNESLEGYFILRSLEKLRPRGLAAFISAKGFMSNRGGKDSRLRYLTALKAEFLGAYRLPNKMFEMTGADVVTDVLVFRKYDSDAAEKISELVQQNVEVLRSSKVLWDEFLEGKYFELSGRRFMLGEKAVGTGRWGEVERVISDDSIENVSRLLKRFGDSRIDWPALDAVETLPISYSEGDTVSSGGVTHILRNGIFVAVRNPDGDSELAVVLESMQTAADSIGSHMDWAAASQLFDSLHAKSAYDNVPPWLLEAITGIRRGLPSGEHASAFDTIRTAIALQEVLSRHGQDEPFPYAETYPALHRAIKTAAAAARKLPKRFAGNVRDALKLLAPGVIYTARSDVYTQRWTGEALAAVEPVVLTPTQRYERVKYENTRPDGFIPLDSLRQAMGAEFDLEDWCLSADGTGALSADDYYTGNYAEFLQRTSVDLEAVEDSALRAKLISQRQAADVRLVHTDVSQLGFNLATPFVTIERKVEFLRKYVDGGFSLVLVGEDGPLIDFDASKSKLARNSEQLRNMRRFADYIKNGALSTRTSREEKEDDPELEQARLERLRELIGSANQQFEAWAKSNPSIQAGLRERFSDPENLYFRQLDDESPLEIPGLNPGKVPHGYQNAGIRGYARKMSGILGFDVGLGKTLTALITIQHIQSIGVKKKTIIVVPNATLTNWRKESIDAYASTADCLYVGVDVDKNGKVVVDSGNNVRDMNAILNNQHRKIFMTFEAFGMIPLRDETRESYSAYLAAVERSLDASDVRSKADSVRVEGKLAGAVHGASQGSGAVPFFEDMGIDSIVIDEAHAFKNSKDTVDFQAAKYLSDPTPSARGLDAQIKCWYVRGKSKLNDGVLPLTATPLTNSPLEIYSMLTLSVGEIEVNRRMGGVRGADAFMEAFCDVSEEYSTSLAGVESMRRVFRGLNNTKLLRNVLGQIATIRTGKEVGLKAPEVDVVATKVALSEPPIMAELQRLQRIYANASAIQRNRQVSEEGMMEVLSEAAATGEAPELLAHPFNFINKVTKVIADPELGRQSTVFLFSDLKKAEAVVQQFNTKAIKEERRRRTPLLAEENIIKVVTKKKGDETTEVLMVKVAAVIVENRIEIDTESFSTQREFLKLADKAGLELDATIPPKIAALLENFQKEQAHPLAGGKAKQLIFCDMLGLHNKLRVLLTRRTGIAAGAIAIINGEAVRDPGDMQSIQDGFNAEGEENRYEVAILNKKGEVGINLQRGTQAIHHLTIGWTPDSIHQRNGRGARQGNWVDTVKSYFYDAIGTFDQYKRTIVGKKSDWIGEVIAGDGNKVQISAGISRQDMEMLAEAAGSEEGLRKVEARIAQREVDERRRVAQEAVASNVQNMLAQMAVVNQYPTVGRFLGEKIADAAEAYLGVTTARARLESAKKIDDLARVARAQGVLDKAEIAYERQAGPIRLSINILSQSTVKSLEEAFMSSRWRVVTRGTGVVKGIAREAIINEVADTVAGNSYYAFKFAVAETGPISEEWDVEVTIAKQLAEQSAIKAVQLCDAAGIAVDRIEQVRAGSAKVVRGQIVGVGDFALDGQDRVWLMVTPTQSFCLDMKAKKRLRGTDDKLLTATVIGREHPKYQSMVLRAAELDDSIIAHHGGALPESATGYFTYSADVRNALTVVPRQSAAAWSVRFRAPIYPLMVDGEAQGDPLLELIIKEQRAIATLQGDRAIFDVGAVDLENYKVSERNRVYAMVAFAIERGMRITETARRVLLQSSGSNAGMIVDALDRVLNPFDVSAALDSLKALETVEEVDSAVEAMVAKHYSLLDLAADESWVMFYPLSVKSMLQAVKAAHGMGAKIEDVEAALALSGDPEELVAIVGDTKAFKETIKETALGFGIKAIFRGKWPCHSLKSAPVNSWVVPRKVYSRLLEMYADDVRRYRISLA